ncbi:hypothetical protein [Runella limosa]|uniref:hypothetical protein n=1 Tax=Runella limosa TaxID=370978 RepID=UPI00048B4D73|nr:hypothetical protein [Runella limosa]
MAEVTFQGICEGKISKFQQHLGDIPYMTVACIIADRIPLRIDKKDVTSFILLQFPVEGILSIVPTDNTIIFEDKKNNDHRFTLYNITVTDSANFEIVIQKKSDGSFVRTKGSKEANSKNLAKAELSKELTSDVALDETVNDTVSRPPCN